MIIGLGGKLSSGKTCTAVKFAFDEAKKGKKVISNIKLTFPETVDIVKKDGSVKVKRIRTVYLPNEEFIDFIKRNAENPKALKNMFYHSVLLLDEITNLFNARKSGSLINDLTTMWIMMVGKLSTDVIFTYQVRNSQVDRRLREISNIHGNCYRVTENGKPVIFGDRILKRKIFIVVVLELDLDLYGKRIAKEVYDPEPIYSLYDTREVVILDRSKYSKKGHKSLANITPP